MGTCQSTTAAVALIAVTTKGNNHKAVVIDNAAAAAATDDDDPMIRSLRGNREMSLQDHLVTERSAQSFQESYDVWNVLQQGRHSQILQIKRKQQQQQQQQQRSSSSSSSSSSSITFHGAKTNQDNNNNNNNNDDDHNNTTLYILKRLAVHQNQEDNIMDDNDVSKYKFVHDSDVHSLKREAAILMECDHPNIIKLLQLHKDHSSNKNNKKNNKKKKKNNKNHHHASSSIVSSLILEYCPGGTVESRLHTITDERHVSRIVRQVLEALAYLHQKNIVHRDIHLSNIVFESHHPDSDIKLIDFGCATVWNPVNHNNNNNDKTTSPGKKSSSGSYYMKDKVGTLQTMAPDVIKGKYSSKADIWSVGVVAYQLLHPNKKAPFQGNTVHELEQQILKGYVSYQHWTASSAAKEFVQQCLAMNPGYRPTAMQALFQFDSFIGTSKPRPSPLLIPNRLVVSFQLYRQCSPLKRAAWNVLARQVPPSDVIPIRQLFCNLDVNRSGTLTRDEFVHGFGQCGFDRDELASLFEALDINGNDEILFTEFLAASLETLVQHWDDTQLREAFDVLDEDHSGFISHDNLTKLLGNSPKLRHMLLLLLDEDKDNDKDDDDDKNHNHNINVSFEEFQQLFHPATTATAYHINGTMETLDEISSVTSES